MIIRNQILLILLLWAFTLNANAHAEVYYNKIYSPCSTKHSENQQYQNRYSPYFVALNNAATNFCYRIIKPVIGIDYEYKLSHPTGVGLVAEIEFTENLSYLSSIPVFYHSVNSLNSTTDLLISQRMDIAVMKQFKQKVIKKNADSFIA